MWKKMTGVIKIFLYKIKEKPHNFNKNDPVEIELDDINTRYTNYNQSDQSDQSDPYNPLNLKNEFILSGHCNDGLRANSVCGHDDDIEFSQDNDIHKLIIRDLYFNNTYEDNINNYSNNKKIKSKKTVNAIKTIKKIKKYIISIFKKP